MITVAKAHSCLGQVGFFISTDQVITQYCVMLTGTVNPYQSVPTNFFRQNVYLVPFMMVNLYDHIVLAESEHANRNWIALHAYFVI